MLAEIKPAKIPAELALLRKAAALTDATMAVVRDLLEDGGPNTERELQFLG